MYAKTSLLLPVTNKIKCHRFTLNIESTKKLFLHKGKRAIHVRNYGYYMSQKALQSVRMFPFKMADFIRRSSRNNKTLLNPFNRHSSHCLQSGVQTLLVVKTKTLHHSDKTYAPLSTNHITV